MSAALPTLPDDDPPGDEFADIGPVIIPGAMNRYLRAYVTLPDGRQIAGRRPGRSGVSFDEHLLRDELAKQICGITEAKLGYGRADVLTEDSVFEVETVAKWRHGVRQVLAYSAECGLPPSLAVFGKMHRDEVLKIYLKLRDSKPQIVLWWYGHSRWERITSRVACRNMPSPLASLERLKAAAKRAS